VKRLLLACLLLSAVPCYAQLDKRYFVEAGYTMLDEERYGDAVRTLSLLLSVDGEVQDAYFLRGLAKFRLGDLPGAENDLSRAVELSPVFMQAYFHRAMLRATTGDYDGALADYDMVVDIRPDVTVAYLMRAATLFETGDYPRALNDLNRYIRLEGSNADAHILRGEVRLNMSDTLGARADFDAAVEANRNNPRAYYSRGMLEASQQRWDEALADLTRALERDSTFLPVLFHRASVHYEAGHPREALRDLNALIAKDTGYTAAYYNRAVVKRLLGDTRGAAADLDTARRKFVEYRLADPDPERDLSRLVSFDTLLVQGMHARRPNIAAAIRPMLMPRAEGPEFEAGVEQLALKQYTAAVNLFSEAVDRHPADGNLYLARAVARAGMTVFISSMNTWHGPSEMFAPPPARTYSYDESFADIETALRLMPRDARALYNRGNLNVATGNMEQALEDYSQAIGINPALAEAWFNRALVRIYLNDTAGGLLDLGRAGELGIDESYEILKTYRNHD
jgi:tetratricopeptide (TPR) repeat protein